MAHFPNKVKIVEVGPRDGLQNESVILNTNTKIDIINELAQTGLTDIEAGAFVQANKIPQLADSDQVFRGIQRNSNARYIALVPNDKGMERAIAAKVDQIAIFTAASETFCRHNINCSIDESLQRFKPVIQRAQNLHIPVRAYISCVLGCPYEGEIPRADVVSLAERLFKLGCVEISLGDTIGVGTPLVAQHLIKEVMQSVPVDQLAIHFHNTKGQALANIYACLEQGISIVDTSIAGLGGCPYAPGASGNVATEEVLYMLHGMGIATGVDLNKVLKVVTKVREILKRAKASTY